ncbi:MAG: multidrug effflux MFS transporter [Rhizobiales bacterium]|nr:multidrug effflux MFS transporter [Hyphomicrobiales bacterium]
MNHQKDHIPKPHIALLIMLSALSPVALNIFIPSMPSLTASLNTNYTTSQLTLTLYLVALAFAQLILGPLSDKYGRRPVLLIGVAVYAVSSLACAFAFNIEQLITGRIFQAAGGCVGVVITRAIVRDLYDKNKAASIIGYMTMIMVLAPMSAPIIGGYIDQYADWRGSFYFVSLIGLIIFGYSFIKLHETNKNPIRDIDFVAMFKKYGILIRQKQYMGYIASLSFSSAVFFAFIADASRIATEQLGLLPSEYGYYFILVSLGYMLGNFLSGKFAQRLGNVKMIMYGNIVLSVGIIVLLYVNHIEFTHPFYLFIPMTFVACSNGIIIPSSMAEALSVRPDIAGSASGLAGFTQVASGAIATLIVGYFYDGSTTPMVATMLGAAVLSIFTFIVVIRKTAPLQNLN